MQLQAAAEEKLLSLLPAKERNKILKMRQQATPEEIANAEHSVLNWAQDIKRLDSKLASHKESSQAQSRPLPPVRGVQAPIQVTETAKKKPAIPAGSSNKKRPTEKRLSGYNFRAWEKFDVDAALEQIDNEDEEDQDGGSAESLAKAAEDISYKRQLLHAQEMHRLLDKMQAGNLTEEQAKMMAG